MKYTTTLDKMAKMITIGVTLLFAVIIVLQCSIMKASGDIVPYLVIAMLLLVYGISYTYRPMSYLLTADTLIIQRPIKDVTIQRDQIKGVERIDDTVLSGSVRTFAVGGLFGYYGKFANTKIGNMTWYATRNDAAVLIKTTDNQKIVLTPDDIAGFIADLQTR
jgi:Bacterial PH domain